MHSHSQTYCIFHRISSCPLHVSILLSSPQSLLSILCPSFTTQTYALTTHHKITRHVFTFTSCHSYKYCLLISLSLIQNHSETITIHIFISALTCFFVSHCFLSHRFAKFFSYVHFSLLMSFPQSQSKKRLSFLVLS